MEPYMQIATITTFPGPCRNVVLLPDRGCESKKIIYLKWQIVFGTYIICKVHQENAY